jgi:hypothetical protein
MSYVREKQHKIQLVEEMRDPILRNKLKQCKLCALDHIETQLANEATIDLATFFSLCFLFDIQLFYFNHRCYYQTIPEEVPWKIKAKAKTSGAEADGPDREEKQPDLFDLIYDPHGTGYDEDDYDFATIQILRQTSGSYWIEPTNVLDIDWNRCYQITNIKKPLKAISSYTAPQLLEIARIFDIDCNRKNKQEIYDRLQSILTLDIR